MENSKKEIKKTYDASDEFVSAIIRSNNAYRFKDGSSRYGIKFGTKDFGQVMVVTADNDHRVLVKVAENGVKFFHDCDESQKASILKALGVRKREGRVRRSCGDACLCAWLDSVNKVVMSGAPYVRVAEKKLYSKHVNLINTSNSRTAKVVSRLKSYKYNFSVSEHMLSEGCVDEYLFVDNVTTNMAYVVSADVVQAHTGDASRHRIDDEIVFLFSNEWVQAHAENKFSI